jgi:hypothetical protein
MNEIQKKKYIKQLAVAVDFYWEGDESKAVSILTQAEADLEVLVGKKDFGCFLSTIDRWLKKWRDSLILPSSSSKISFAQSTDFFQELRPPDDSLMESDSDILLSEDPMPEDDLTPRLPSEP